MPSWEGRGSYPPTPHHHNHLHPAVKRGEACGFGRESESQSETVSTHYIQTYGNCTVLSEPRAHESPIITRTCSITKGAIIELPWRWRLHHLGEQWAPLSIKTTGGKVLSIVPLLLLFHIRHCCSGQQDVLKPHSVLPRIDLSKPCRIQRGGA